MVSIYISAGTLPDDEDVSWINPDNWLPYMTAEVNEAVPHLERIPCHYDWVRFGAELGDFVVVLPNKKINIKRLSYDGNVGILEITITYSNYCNFHSFPYL